MTQCETQNVPGISWTIPSLLVSLKETHSLFPSCQSLPSRPSFTHNQQLHPSEVGHFWPLRLPRLDSIFSITSSYFPLCGAATGRRRKLATSPSDWWAPCDGALDEMKKHWIVWRRFSTASVGEPAELFAHNRVKTCRESG